MSESIRFMQQVCSDFANTLPLSARAAFIAEANRHLMELVEPKTGGSTTHDQADD